MSLMLFFKRGLGTTKNLTFRRDGVIIRAMNAMNGIAKQPPMRPATNAEAGSSIGTGRRGNGGKSHAVRKAGEDAE